MRARMRLPLTCLITVVASVLTAGLVPANAAATAPSLAFYTPPDPLPAGRPGDIIRTQPIIAPLPAVTTRIMYRSTDTHDNPIAVTGAVLSPSRRGSAQGPARWWASPSAPRVRATSARPRA